MKHLITAILLIGVVGCAGEKKEVLQPFSQTAAMEACEKVIADFQSTLKQELMAAMADGGPENAIAICNVRAPMIADSFSQMPGLHIQRVSLRQRNPIIKPDSFETATLEKFAAATGADPQTYFELTHENADTAHFRYMEEIKTGKLCLNCHGDPNTFSAGLKEVLKAHYPEDPAVGYSAGESRGAFSVTLSYPEAEATVTSLAGGQDR